MFVAKKILRKNERVANLIWTTSVNFSEALKFLRSNYKDIGHKAKSSFMTKTNVLYFSSQKDNSQKLEILNENGNKNKNKNKNKKNSNDSLNNFNSAIVKSVRSVARTLGGDKKKISDDILSYLREVKISDSSSKSNKIINYEETSEVQSKKSVEPLNIFDQSIMQKAESQVKLKIWDDLEAEKLARFSKIPPKNWFEEMIVLTNEGKLWQFPIDNDQGMEKEAEISFTEHIFMEQYLEPWCPKSGPLRRFMELVLVGLSKNHYFTVEEKKAHIDWFRKYFEEKKKLLQELGAMGSAKETKKIGNSTPEEDIS